jgi:hypothetical protein
MSETLGGLDSSGRQGHGTLRSSRSPRTHVRGRVRFAYRGKASAGPGPLPLQGGRGVLKGRRVEGRRRSAVGPRDFQGGHPLRNHDEAGPLRGVGGLPALFVEPALDGGRDPGSIGSPAGAGSPAGSRGASPDASRGASPDASRGGSLAASLAVLPASAGPDAPPRPRRPRRRSSRRASAGSPPPAAPGSSPPRRSAGPRSTPRRRRPPRPRRPRSPRPPRRPPPPHPRRRSLRRGRGRDPPQERLEVSRL